MVTLFDSIQMGELSLPNRIIMSPMTRCRASEDRVPTALMANYYRQRATAGLIISEATSVTPMGVGYPRTPGIWSDEQVAGWKPITEAVHQAGGRIVMQLWHVGRISDPVYLEGQQPVAPSAIPAKGHVSLVRPKRAFVTPRALALAEIPDVIAAYRQGAENAQRAGFDGIELHAGNGYLPDQFLQSSTNQRTDEYGGSVENRARLLLDITDAAISVWGAGRVGVHLAPRCDAHDMGDDDPAATFGYVAQALGARGIAFIFTREHFQAPALTPALKKLFGGPLIANEQFTQEAARQAVQQGVADAVAFGQVYIANPDLVARFHSHAPLNPLDAVTMYGASSQGYTDYPALGESLG
ncbi:MAG: alkene reductase [Kiritimatiellae bacterium]|jgi:2,4-dienoyl-CoA reductase-like NADH-dependent reductase (Old Yellow Enzyme family)|nr:alkene reductase [Kiritimatiellia bacterium]MDD4340943.1 alkene reductase [Kiritimatiellia bacterium]MDY0148648.1 alkene reductase [Kiritimatiellia bacterium]